MEEAELCREVWVLLAQAMDSAKPVVINKKRWLGFA